MGLGDAGYPDASSALIALDAAMPAMAGERTSPGSWVRDVFGLLCWTLNRR
jgi:hypothetical protein